MTTDELERVCKWALDKLVSDGSVSNAEIIGKFSDPNANPDEEKKRLAPDCSRAWHAILAILSALKWNIQPNGSTLLLLDREKSQELNAPLVRLANPGFQNTETEAKRQIGDLIAGFLLKPLLSEKTIFLGSGNTILHVGLRMCEEGRHYAQRFVTVNIPLATAWCARDVPPVSKISIPEAVLDTHTFRFSTMPGPGYPLTVSIVAADGCYYDDEKKSVVLYGNEESIAANTSLFVKNTRHTVVFCLTSAKIRRGFTQNPNTGPPISPPKKGVIRVLVTDTQSSASAKVFEKDGWMVVTKADDWQPVLEKMEKGEKEALLD